MSLGWSVNLTQTGYDQEVELPAGPIFETSEGPVVELVFWSVKVEKWIHAVAGHFRRELPAGHVQLAVGDLAWINQVERRLGEGALLDCVAELERCLVPAEEA